MLHLTLGRSLGGILLRAGDLIEPGLLGALVGQDEADVGLVTDHRGNAGVHIHVVADGDIVIAVGGLGHAPLAEDGVDKTVDIGAVVVVLLDDQLGSVDMVHPVGHVSHIVIHTLAADGVHQHSAGDVGAAEEADGLINAGANPIGVAALVDLKGRLIKHIGRVVKAQVAVEVTAKVLGCGVANALAEAHHVHVLGHHVDDQVGRQTFGAVIEPLDEIAVAQRGHTDGAALIVDLGIVPRHFKLRYHIRQLTQLAVAQAHGTVTVQHGNLVVGNLLHLGGKVAIVHRQQVAIAGGSEDLPADDAAHHGGHHQRSSQDSRDLALFFDKAKVALDSFTLEAGGDHGTEAVHRAGQDQENIELPGLEVQRRQRHIEISCGKDQRNQQIDQRAGQRRSDGLAHMTGTALLSLEGILVGKALKIGTVPVNVHGCLLSCI